jgi:hypothetical protein
VRTLRFGAGGAAFSWLSVALAVSWLATAPAEAQQRPLVTQDPGVVGQGRVVVEAGVETGSNIWYPVSGLTGDRVQVPVGVTVGLAPTVDVQLTAGGQWLAIDRRDVAPLDFRVRPGDSTSDVMDVALAFKVRVLAEGQRRPAVGLRFVTELPTAGNESGMGHDTLNFSASVLVGKTINGFRVAGNAGLLLLSDVLQGSLQQDALVGGVSVTRGLTPSVDLAGEFFGRRVLFADVPPIGAEPHGQVRAAVRYTRNAWRADAGVIVGTTQQDPDFGVTLGVTWMK